MNTAAQRQHVEPFLPHGRPFTRADLDRMPDDGNRYELIDGVLFVSPGPRSVHQEVLANLHFTMRSVCPRHLRVLFAPFDVALSSDTVMQPDLLVIPKEAIKERGIDVAPLLTVEVLSPSTRSVDLLLKKDRLQRAGCPHYWVIDPDEPSITAWTLVDGTYQEVAHVTDGEAFRVEDPFPVSFTPESLLN
ncbi:MAG: Uma2 family endonuclease [Galactobacter sp.]